MKCRFRGAGTVESKLMAKQKQKEKGEPLPKQKCNRRAERQKHRKQKSNKIKKAAEAEKQQKQKSKQSKKQQKQNRKATKAKKQQKQKSNKSKKAAEAKKTTKAEKQQKQSPKNKSEKFKRKNPEKKTSSVEFTYTRMLRSFLFLSMTWTHAVALSTASAQNRLRQRAQQTESAGCSRRVLWMFLLLLLLCCKSFPYARIFATPPPAFSSLLCYIILYIVSLLLCYIVWSVSVSETHY